MTEFEYFSAMIAVILALGVTHILGYIGLVARNPRLVTMYWVHTAWVVLVLLSHFAAWWNIWGLRDSLQFNLHAFLYMLVGPTALYLAARVIVPPLQVSGRLDLESHYYSTHRMFFAILGVFLVWPVLLHLALSGAVSLTRFGEHLALLIPIAACAISANRRLHMLVVVLIGIAVLVGA